MTFARPQERYMAQLPTFGIRGRDSPTLWPPRPEGWTPLEFAIEACEEENRLLKVMVIGLSELILETVASHK
jgi:hypothetical protein